MMRRAWRLNLGILLRSFSTAPTASWCSPKKRGGIGRLSQQLKRKTSSRLQARNKIAGMTRGTGQNRFKLLREAGEFAVRGGGVCFGVGVGVVLCFPPRAQR